MIKKDFKVIAACLKDTRPKPDEFKTKSNFDVALTQWHFVFQSFYFTLKALNPKYNGEKFKDACFKE